MHNTSRQITPVEYATMWGKSRQYVTRVLSKGKELNHVKSVSKFGKIYILTVPIKLTKENFKTFKSKKK